MPRRQTTSEASPSMRSPAKAMEPWFGANTPAIMLNKVVLPAPFGPMTAKIDPGAHIVDGKQAAKALAEPLHLEQRAHGCCLLTPSLRASQGHTPSGSTIT